MTISSIDLHDEYGLTTIQKKEELNMKFPTLTSPLDTVFELTSYSSTYPFKLHTNKVSASLFQEKLVRFYLHEKKNQRKLAELNLKTDEMVQVNHLFYVNPQLDLTTLSLYIGVQHRHGGWVTLEFSYEDLMFERFNKEHYPALDELYDFNLFSLKEVNKRIAFYLKRDLDDLGRLEIIDENQFYKGFFFSRDKEKVETFVDQKSRAQEERNLYTYQREEIKEKLRQLQHSFEYEENQEKVEALLTHMEELFN